ncbi:hypothetical protein CMK18_20585 [Candidatus Poribacteria bacterium]|nr:hypothetical protein [Candidatus Poribacteria bacterium]
MSNLIQSPTSVSFYKGWYGKCGNEECLPFNLSDIKSKLKYVYQTSGLNDGYIVYNASLPDRFNIFKTLQCGHSYILILKPGSDTISIPHFITSSHGTDDFGRIVAECEPSLTPTPSITVTPSITPTITVSATPNLTPTVTPTVTPPPPELCDGFPHTLPGEHPLAVGGIRVQGVHKDAIVCHMGTTGGTGWNTVLKLNPSGDLAGVLVINGALLGSDIRYRHHDGVVYTGQISMGTSITILNKV